MSLALGIQEVAVRSASRMNLLVSKGSGNACRNMIDVCNTPKELAIAVCMIQF